MSYATFSGSGSDYFTRAVLPALTAYPFFVIADVQLYERADYSTPYTIWSAERAAGGHGTAGIINEWNPIASADDGSTVGQARSPEASLQRPYVDKLLCMFVSTTERRIYINGVLEDTNATSIVINLSTGSPVFRIGLRAAAGQAFQGSLANVACGTGTPTSGDIALLSVPGVNYSTVTLAGATMTNWYPLNGNGNDSIGGANMTTVGTITYTSGTLASPAQPKPNQVIQYALMQPNLTADVPTITVNQTPPSTLSTGSWTNFAGCDYYDISFTGNAGAWNTRAYLIRCTTPVAGGRRVVFQDAGHAVQANWASPYRDNVVAQAINTAGYDVMITQLPLEGPTDPGYTGSDQLHDAFYSDFISGVKNPMERWCRVNSALMTSIQGTYAKRAIIGLSGGAARSVYIAAMDPRYNWATVSVRGTLPHRRLLGAAEDFEQRTYVMGYKYEDLYSLCAAGNRRLWICCSPTDNVGLAQFVGGGGSPGGAYLSASSLDTNFLAPIRAQFPYSDVQFFEDQGPSQHAWSDWCITNVVLPALSAGLSTVYYADKVLAGTNYKPEFFTQQGSPAWYDDLVFSSPESFATSFNLTGVQGSGSVGTFGVSINPNISLTGVQGIGSVGTFAVSINPNVSLTGLQGVGSVGTFGISISPNVSLVGVQGVGSVGSFTVNAGSNVSFNLAGVQGVGSVGTFAVSISSSLNVNLVGVQGTGSVGTFTVNTGSNLNVNLTGVQGVGSVGAFAVNAGSNINFNLTGLQGVGSVGTFGVAIDGNLSVNLVGVQGAGSVGAFTVSGTSIPVNLLGVQGVGAVGSFTVVGTGVIIDPYYTITPPGNISPIGIYTFNDIEGEDDRVILTVDFKYRLPTDVTILTAQVSISVAPFSLEPDASPADRLDGSGIVTDGAKVSNWFHNGLPWVDYYITFRAILSNSEIISITGSVLVVPNVLF